MKKIEGSVQTALRISKKLLADVDKYAARMRKQEPGACFTRADAMRVLITSGLIFMNNKVLPELEKRDK